MAGRGQRGVPGDPFLAPPQAPQMPPPGFIDYPAVSIARGPQEEFGFPQGPVPVDGPGGFGPPQGSFPDLPGDLNPQAPFPGSYYPQQGPFSGNVYPQGPQGPPLANYYPQQVPQGSLPGNFNPQGSLPGDGPILGGSTGSIPGVPGTYAPQNPGEYGTQFFNRALQTR